jgi:hypothetical protein
MSTGENIMKEGLLMIEVVTQHNIDELLKNPSEYVDDGQDHVLVKVYDSDVANPVLIMIGVEEEAIHQDNPWYIIEEDNDVSIYHHCTMANLASTYEKVLRSVCDDDQEG